MKRIAILITMILVCAIVWADYAPGMYLQVTETGISPWTSIPVEVYVAVTDKSDAEAKLPAVLAEHFIGKAYEAYYHQHYLDRPCVWELLATGTCTP